jgi:hypothetical protein
LIPRYGDRFLTRSFSPPLMGRRGLGKLQEAAYGKRLSWTPFGMLKSKN